MAAQGERRPRETAATEAEISIGVATSPETVMIGEAEAKAVATGGLEVVEGAETAGTAESEVPHALAPAEGRVEIGVAIGFVRNATAITLPGATIASVAAPRSRKAIIR